MYERFCKMVLHSRVNSITQPEKDGRRRAWLVLVSIHQCKREFLENVAGSALASSHSQNSPNLGHRAYETLGFSLRAIGVYATVSKTRCHVSNFSRIILDTWTRMFVAMVVGIFGGFPPLPPRDAFCHYGMNTNVVIFPALEKSQTELLKVLHFTYMIVNTVQ